MFDWCTALVVLGWCTALVVYGWFWGACTACWIPPIIVLVPTWFPINWAWFMFCWIPVYSSPAEFWTWWPAIIVCCWPSDWCITLIGWLLPCCCITACCWYWGWNCCCGNLVVLKFWIFCCGWPIIWDMDVCVPATIGGGIDISGEFWMIVGAIWVDIGGICCGGKL